MRVETLAEWEELRDAVAKKRDTARRALDKIFDEEFMPVMQALRDLQLRCKHPNMIIRDKNGSHSERCPDCDHIAGWGTALPDDTKEDAALREDMRTFLKRKSLL